MTDGTDQTSGTERIRLIIDTDEILRRAVRIRAAKMGLSPSDVVNDLIRAHLAPEVAEITAVMKAADKGRKKGG